MVPASKEYKTRFLQDVLPRAVCAIYGQCVVVFFRLVLVNALHLIWFRYEQRNAAGRVETVQQVKNKHAGNI